MKLLPKSIWKTMFLFIACFGATMEVRAQDSLLVDSIVSSNRAGIESLLQGNAAGLRVKSWSGTPGTQSTINLRGLSLDPTDQSTMPLILIDGVPMIASPSKVTGINPLSYFSADQVERIEIIRSIDALAAYGVQAPNGAINIIMKQGGNGAIHVRANAFVGANFLQNMDYRKDAFYNFNTTGRRDIYGSGSVLHDQSVQVYGGGNYGSYLFGLTNHYDEGVVKGSNYGRQSLYLNAKYNITDKFSAHFYNNLGLGTRNGRYAGEFTRDIPLPVVSGEGFVRDKKRNVGLLSFMGLTYQFNPSLKASSVASISYEGASRDVYVPSNVLNGSIYASSISSKRQLVTVKTAVDWIHNFSDALKLNMTIGNEIRSNDENLTSVNGSRSMESGGSDFVQIVTGYNANQVNAFSDQEIEKIVSFYGIWKWNYKQDLDVNMVLRADGSSFYKDKWALYPALGVHYDLKNSLKIPVKLNAAFGKTGILSRPEVYRGELGAYGEYFGGNELGIGTVYPAFQNAKSVGVYQLDAGLTFDINSSISLSANYFNKIYEDFTYRRYLSNISGTDYQYETGGSVGLSGVEFNLDGKWFRTKNFSWTTNLNIASYKNKVRSLPADAANTSLAFLSGLSNGDAVSSFAAYQGNQQKVIGNSEPKGFGGITNTFRFKNISASATVSYAWGADVLTESYNSTYYADQVGYTFPTKSGETPYYLSSIDANGRTVYQGIRTIEDATFVRLNRASLTYHFGSAVLKRLAAITDLQLFLRGDNLLTLTKYSGINPEENVNGVRKRDLSTTGTPLPSNLVLGIKLVL